MLFAFEFSEKGLESVSTPNEEEGRTFADFVNWAASMTAHRYLKSRTLIDICTIPREMVVQGRMNHFEGMSREDLFEELRDAQESGIQGVERMTLEDLWAEFQLYILGNYEGPVAEVAGEFLRENESLIPVVYGQAGIGKSSETLASTDTRLD